MRTPFQKGGELRARIAGWCRNEHTGIGAACGLPDDHLDALRGGSWWSDWFLLVVHGEVGRGVLRLPAGRPGDEPAPSWRAAGRDRADAGPGQRDGLDP